mgnify:CR=1 FL=1
MSAQEGERSGSKAMSSITKLLVEQNVREALDLADRGYVLQTGKIVTEGSGRELLDNPEVQASFLGG